MKRHIFTFLLVLGSLCLASCSKSEIETVQQPGKPAEAPPQDHAMVVSASREASEVGKQIIEMGGNAVDAAIAVHFALAVTYPYAGNIGGGGFMVIRLADGTAATLDFRETAPASAHRDMYLDANGNVIPGKSSVGILSAGVPGAVDGMVKAHEKYGSLPWKDLVQPAVELARKGFPVPERDARQMNEFANRFAQLNNDKSKFNYLVKPGGWKTGDTLRQPDLAECMERIRDNGRAGFYEGKTAELIVNEMKLRGGIITAEDLKNYAAKWREPLTGEYKGMKLITMGPPSSGGVCLLMLLKMLENQELGNMGFHSEAAVHRMVEAERRVYADRAEHLGDPDFWKVNVKGLLDSAYLQSRWAGFSADKATPSKQIKAGTPPRKESEETTHFSVVDNKGNAVALTTTVNAPFGSLVFVQGAGFLLNDEMDDFSAKPGVPNQFGLLGNEANAIQPGKRMLSAMTPLIVEKEGKLLMVLGSPGGSTIITTVLQVYLNVVEFNKSLKDAVAAPRFHSQWLPDLIYIEDNAPLPAGTMNRLRTKGHVFKLREHIGSVDAIMVLPDGKLEGVPDPRRKGFAAGW